MPGSPLVAEQTVVLLREYTEANNIDLHILPSMSFLDLCYVKLGIDPIAGLRIIDAGDVAALADAGQYPLIITQVYSNLVASDLKLALMNVLEDDAKAYFLRNLGLPDESCYRMPLYELDRQKNTDHLTSIYIPKQMEKLLMEDEIFEALDDSEVYEDIGWSYHLQNRRDRSPIQAMHLSSRCMKPLKAVHCP